MFPLSENVTVQDHLLLSRPASSLAKWPLRARRSDNDSHSNFIFSTFLLVKILPKYSVSHFSYFCWAMVLLDLILLAYETQAFSASIAFISFSSLDSSSITVVFCCFTLSFSSLQEAACFPKMLQDTMLAWNSERQNWLYSMYNQWLNTVWLSLESFPLGLFNA